jgi:hypothetical protein
MIQFIQNKKILHLINILNDNTNYHMNDFYCVIPIINIINVEQYNLQFDFVIQSHNGLNQKL